MKEYVSEGKEVIGLTQTVAILDERIRRLEGESTPPSHET